MFSGWKTKNVVLGIWIIFGEVQSGLKLILPVEYDGHVIVLDDL